MSYGENQETAGGTRYFAGKPGMWWATPLRGLRFVVEVTTYGAKKYAPLDWAKGQSFSTLFDCLCRHVESMSTFGIWSRDEESGKYHAAHAAWNLLALLHFMALGREDLDDVTPHLPAPRHPEQSEANSDGHVGFYGGEVEPLEASTHRFIEEALGPLTGTRASLSGGEE